MAVGNPWEFREECNEGLCFVLCLVYSSEFAIMMRANCPFKLKKYKEIPPRIHDLLETEEKTTAIT